MEASTNQPPEPGKSPIASQGSQGDLPTDIKEQASEIKTQAKARISEAARSGQSTAADQLHKFAEGMRRSVDSWDESQHAWVRQGLSTVADSLDRFSADLRHRDLAELVGGVEDTARRHPAAFAAACAVAGFAVVRFLKSSGRDRHRAGGPSPDSRWPEGRATSVGSGSHGLSSDSSNVPQGNP